MGASKCKELKDEVNLRRKGFPVLAQLTLCTAPLTFSVRIALARVFASILYVNRPFQPNRCSRVSLSPADADLSASGSSSLLPVHLRSH